MAQVRPDFTKGEAVIPAVVGAPRGFGKSTPLAFAYPLWEALHGRRHCIIIGSETAGYPKAMWPASRPSAPVTGASFTTSRRSSSP